MPEWLFAAYATMLGRLQAEEQHALVTGRFVAGGVQLEKDAREKYLAQLRQDAQGLSRPPRAPKVTLGQLRAAGIKMRPPEGGEV